MAGASLSQTLRRSPLIAATLYVAAIMLLIGVAWSMTLSVLDSRSELRRTSAVLDEMAGRKAPVTPPAFADADVTGSPFLQGQTVTVAGASLLQRVAASVLKAGGTVQSSQVDINGQVQKSGMVSATINCEVDPAGLQGLLYDIEAKMPFLFLEQFDAQLPQGNGPGDARRLRVVLNVSGQWLPGK